MSGNQTERPLLSVVMIVKDEARGICKTLQSVLPAIDRFDILDTGSSDGTQKMIRDVMKGLPGGLVEEPFVDFSTSRNRALELAGQETVFTLMLSGDEILHDPLALRAFCESYRDHGNGAYDMRIQFGDSSYASARLARTDANWRYVGVTHEVLIKPGESPPSIEVPEAYIFHDRSARDPEGQRQRWEKDKELLERQFAEQPSDTRTAFYLAQTLECLGCPSSEFLGQMAA